MIVSNPNTSRTALRALSVLELMAEAGGPVTVADIAEGIGADRSTAYRMLLTLAEAGYVLREASGRRYRLGYRLLSLSRSLLREGERSSLILACLDRVARETRETAHFSVLDRDAAVLVYRARGTQLVAVDFQIGDRSPLHCTSIGKVLLAFNGPDLFERTVATGLPRVAPNTITDPARLAAEIARVREAGYAYDDLEFAEDMRCVAVPLFEKGGIVVGGMSLSGPASRYSIEKLDELRAILLVASQDLSRQLLGLP
ncbi:MAG TPA: IclR family transcriptional regulator [Bauldia sp.]|nr:IclR family transcriptional regulator [Bauldia sp.]